MYKIILFPGKADCPYYVRTELLGDRLQRNLSDFKVHKIVKQPDDWEVVIFCPLPSTLLKERDVAPW